MNLQLHLVTTHDLFCNFDVNKVKGKGNIKRIYKCADKMALTRKIFLTFMLHFFQEFLEGGQVFAFPGMHEARMKFRVMKDSTLKAKRQKGDLSELDIVMADFRYYEPVIQYRVGHAMYIRQVRLSDNFKQQIMDKVNTGFKYC